MLLPIALCLFAAPQDLAKDLRSKDPHVRLEAVKKLAEDGHEDQEKLLAKALKDKDWEVVEIAAVALGGCGTERSVDPLLELALNGPVRRVRLAAGLSLGAITPGEEPQEVFEKLAKKLGHDQALAAAEAIAGMAPALDGRVPLRSLEKTLASRDASARRAAARAIVLIAGKDRPARLDELLEHEDVAVRASALEGATEARDKALMAVLADYLKSTEMHDVLERRALEAGRATIAAGAELEVAFEAVPVARARFARLIATAGEERHAARPLDATRALRSLGPFFDDESENVRAAAAHALGRIGTDAALARAVDVAKSDPDGRVRRVAFLAVADHTELTTNDEVRRLAIELLADSDARVREVAAVAVGKRGIDAALEPLKVLLNDSDPAVFTAAAISLGKLQTKEAVPALVELYRTAEDWEGRASAVAGLAHVRKSDAVPPLIAALADEEALVRRTAYEFLFSIARQDLGSDPVAWSKWWAANERRVRLDLPPEVLERRRELQYVSDPKHIYEGLDVVVLQSRGDKIEDVLEFLELQHRTTSTGRLVDEAIHPEAIVVSNCSGEINNAEAKRLRWFVRSGGYLFGSCWALRETIERTLPGRVRQLAIGGQVLGEVPAHPGSQASIWLENVFPQSVIPIYALDGAHLIEVLDKEEVEVLIDSPECAAQFGGGNLAAWFRAGHGLVLDSVNHFRLQGFDSARGLKKPVDRQAYAVDHMGLSYGALRETRQAKYWSRASATSDNIKDLSVFQLLTNFVRVRRSRTD